MSTVDNLTIDGRTSKLHITDFTPETYQLFLGVKGLPQYDVKANGRGYVCTFPTEYIGQLGIEHQTKQINLPLDIPDFLFDRQIVGVRVGFQKQRYAFFYDAGLGKTLLFAELARQLAYQEKKILIVSPLNVIEQTIEEIEKFYPNYPKIVNLHNSRTTIKDLVNDGFNITIVNHEWFRVQRNLTGIDCIILDESSILKSSHGKISTNLINGSKGIQYKYCFSATPAPNDRREYARHALFLELIRSENEFLSRWFVTKDQGWVMRKHSVGKFYQYLASWSIFMRHPEAYGLEPVHLPPYQEIMVKVDMTQEQVDLINRTLGNNQLSLAGMPSKPRNWHERQTYNQVSKGFLYQKPNPTIFVHSHKPKAILERLQQYPNEQAIVWTVYDEEGQIIHNELEKHTDLKVVQITGSTPQNKRAALIHDFRHGKTNVLITKPSLLGLGLNLHCATLQFWSGLRDCYDEKTEILTQRGWLSFGELKKDDFVATTNPQTLEFEWQQPTKIVWEHYNGPMIHLYGQRSYDLLVTPNHKLFVQRPTTRYNSGDFSWHFEYAQDIHDNYKRQQWNMLSTCTKYRGNMPVRFHIPSLPESVAKRTTQEITGIDGSDFVRLIGWYITEGYCRPVNTPEFGRIVICQSKEKNRQGIISLMKRIGLNVNSKTKDITGYCKNLAYYLITNFGAGSYHKHIPQWIKNLDSSYLVILRDVMLKGDGCHNKGIPRFYRTVSKQLADDFQEICLKTGVKTAITKREVTGDYGNCIVYDVALSWEHTTPTISNKPEMVTYNGMIGCVTVPNHTIIVRRNGKAVISGNSYEKYYQGVKRSYRYPQTKTVKVFLLYTEYEKAILDNVLSKRDIAEADYAQQEKLYTASLYDEIQDYLSGDFVSLREDKKAVTYDPVITENYQLYHTDSVAETLKGLAENSVDLAVFSPPFPADIFAYTDSVSDMGNTGGKGIQGNDEYLCHLEFCLEGVYKTLKDGRICAIEIQQSPRRKSLDGVIGMYDSRGSVIRIAEKVGFYQVGEWPVLDNPQAKAIISHISTLNMDYVHKDRAKLAPMMLTYIVILRKPGENEIPITNQVAYVPLKKLLEEDVNTNASVNLEKEWELYQVEPTQHEWPLMIIEDKFVNRIPGAIWKLTKEKDSGAKPPNFVKIENEEWLIPVLLAWVTNENWICYADGIAQSTEFNRAASRHDSIKQKQRFSIHTEKLREQYSKVKDYILYLEDKKAKGDIEEKEILALFTGAFVDIDQTATLNTPFTRGRTKEIEDADRHVCPFSIPLVDRLIRLYSNVGETVLDPFGGVGTVPMKALELGRKAIALELKPEYFISMAETCERVASKPKQLALF